MDLTRFCYGRKKTQTLIIKCDLDPATRVLHIAMMNLTFVVNIMEICPGVKKVWTRHEILANDL